MSVIFRDIRKKAKILDSYRIRLSIVVLKDLIFLGFLFASIEYS
jgi:hypothetical protein